MQAFINDQRFGRFWAGIMVKLLSISNEEALREVSVSVGRSVVLLLCRLGVSVMPGQQPIR